MDVRVTGQTQSANAIANLRRQQSAVAKYQDQITSGVRIKVASDDPSAYVAAAQTRRASERNQTYQNTITSATAGGWIFRSNVRNSRISRWTPPPSPRWTGCIK